MTRRLGTRMVAAVVSGLMTGLMTGLVTGLVTGSAVAAGDAPARCDHHDPLRQPFFGDMHVHTIYSFDAWAQGTRNTPRDAYGFARGDALGIQPYDDDGKPLRTVQLRRPLDFAMVSDHAEMLGETRLCRIPGTEVYDTYTCRMMRGWPLLGYMIVNSQWTTSGARSRDLCGDDGSVCRQAAIAPWRELIAAAEEFNEDSGACGFTAFPGFEWSGTRAGMVHRNVVFRNADIPTDEGWPPNAMDDRNDETRLWQRLLDDCIDADSECDAISIPHNSNVSNGSLFWDVAPDGTPLDAAMAARRRDLEPLLEITQHKGDSECRNDGVDPLCDFETVDFSVVAGHASSMFSDPIPPGVYFREALLDGILKRETLGVNPYRLGAIGATDTHLGTPGLVDEENFVGHAAGTITARMQIPALPDHPAWNPGGLAVVWAEENSRDSLFDAMKRREVYATSGPRIVVRMFAGWDFDDSVCESSALAEQGYRGGVAMGGQLGEHGDAPAGAVPNVIVSALRDPGTAGHEGAPLERIQIIKGWVADGQTRVRVYDVAGSAAGGGAADSPVDSPVDLETCEPLQSGANQLCTVWRDPDFDAATEAFYYARVVEVPTCRWSWHACSEAIARGEVNCDAILPPRGLLAACCDEELPKLIRERAWTSPVWYSPRASALPAD